MSRDEHALPHLIEAMQAASDGDVPRARDALASAAQHAQRSSARPTIEIALIECADLDPNPQTIWTRAFTATRQLTFADPPDVTVLPIPPALRSDDCASCASPMRTDFAFCPACGHRAAQQVPELETRS